MTLPGWLLKRARDLGATHVIPVFAPVDAASAAAFVIIYDLRQSVPGVAGQLIEFHVVDVVRDGVEGGTLTMNRREAVRFLQRFADALGGRLEGEPIPPLPRDAEAQAKDFCRAVNADAERIMGVE